MSVGSSASVVLLGDGQRLLVDALGSSGHEWVAALDATAAAAVVVVVGGAIDDEMIEIVAADPRVIGIVMVASPISARTVELIGGWKEVPVFVVADAAACQSLLASVDLTIASTHPDSELLVVSEPGIPDDPESAGLFGTYDDHLSAAIAAAVAWLDHMLCSSAPEVEVVCTSTDGWEVHGSLRIPAVTTPVPAVVLLHSGRSDRAVFSRLERLISRVGVATLNIDWRGRGRSTNKGRYFELSAGERQQGWRDARAAVELLAADPRIDADRIGMIGVVHGAEHAVAASIDDRRVVALAVLTGYVPGDEREVAHLLSGRVRVLYVTSAGHGPAAAAMRDLARRSPPGIAELRVYPGGAIGYQLFDLDPALEGHIAMWVADALSATDAAMT